MKDRLNAEAVLASVNVVSVVGRYVSLSKRNREYIGLCPFHDDHKNSLMVNESKQIFKCFACGKGGDAIAFLMDMGRTFKEAISELSGKEVQTQVSPEQRELNRKNQVAWTQIIPAPKEPTLNQFIHYKHGQPSQTWKYLTEDGNLIGYVCRFNTADGKEVIPFVFATDGKRKEWRWMGFQRPRPLYGLDRLKSNPDKTVVIYEGEKTADAGQRLLPHTVAIAWPGGAQAVDYIDWSPLTGRNVFLWPDHDKPGRDAMRRIHSHLTGKAKALRFISNSTDFPKHWDIADADWSVEQAKDYAKKNNSVTMPEEIEQDPEPEPDPEPEVVPTEPVKPIDPQPKPPVHEDTNPDDIGVDYFNFMGFEKHDDNLTYYFYVKAAKIVIGFSAPSLNRANLITLAPLNFWESSFFGKNGFNLNAAQNWLITASIMKGPYDDENIRGRGAWLDGKSVVIHSGNKLIIDGINSTLGVQKSGYIYEAGKPLQFHTGNPLKSTDSSKLIDLLSMLNWDRAVNAYLLAGWCVIAPVCGALNWRPHIWLTGASGTGKTWVYREIVRKLLGHTALSVQSNTSEAGVRQLLQHDALPVVFDEAEAETKRAQEAMDKVLSLVRAASADDGGIIAMGTSGGSAKTYRIRSCFAFSSIVVQVKQQADRSRMTILSLVENKSKTKKQEFEKIVYFSRELITEEFAQGLQARTVKLLPTIIANSKTFADAAAVEIGGQRIGDQLGALIAGAYSLVSSNLISFEDAIQWVKARDWADEKSLDQTRDELALLSRILEQTIRVETSTGMVDRSIGELILIAGGRKGSEINVNNAAESLKRHGVRVETGFSDSFMISNTSDFIRKVLEGTPWSKNHNKVLIRLEGAEAVEATRFGSGIVTRAVKIPMTVLVD